MLLPLTLLKVGANPLALAESGRMQQHQQQPEQERWSLKGLLSAFLGTNFCFPSLNSYSH